jgi:putative spermidine/putrescine transport system ATP-binding protein
MLRPERLQVIADTSPAAADMNLFSGTVTDLVYQGDSFLMVVGLADGTQISMRDVSRRDTLTVAAGDVVTLGLHRNDTVLIADEE